MTRPVAVPRSVLVLLLVSLGLAACSGAASSPAAGTPALGASTAPAAGASSPPAAGASSAPSTPDSASSAPGGAVDPCVLVTAADASAALGVSVDPATSEFTGVYQSCAYVTDSQNMIILTRQIDRAGFDAAVAQNPSPSPLPGLCQDAYVISSNVWAWQNGTEVDARVVGTTDLLPAAKQLVTLACGRL